MKKWARILYQPSLPLDGEHRITGGKEHIDISRIAAEEGMVLLKNEQNALPLKPDTRVALFGKASVDYVKGGGGSGDVGCAYVHSLYDGLKLRNVDVFEPLIEFYQEEIKTQYENGGAPGMTREPALSEEQLAAAKEFTDTAIIVINRFSGEGWDRSDIECNNEFNPWESETSMPKLAGKIFPDGDFYLTQEEKNMISAVKERFQKVIAVLNIGGVIDCTWISDDEKINAALYMGQGGMEGGLVAADILFGYVNPSGKLADTFARSIDDYPSTAGFHESFDYVDYTEDIYVGYRYFETIPGAKEKVCYPFGYGLSYTTFATEIGEVKEDTDGISFAVKVKNTGLCAGKEVVQLYYRAPQGLLGKPERELADFVKTKKLQPGEEQEITLFVTPYQMASFDDLGKVKKSAYVLEQGEYEFFIGTSVRDVEKTEYTKVLKENKIVEELTQKLAPVGLKERMKADGTMEALPLGTPKDINACIFEKMEPGTEEALVPEVRARGRYYLMNPYKEGAKTLLDVAEGKATLDEFTEQLSDDELVELLGGQMNTGVANTFGFGNLPEYGVPNAMTADGPAGVRIDTQSGVETTAFPCATLIAYTWNRDVAESIGQAGGEELKENNLAVWLTPAVNIHRNPLCGRNFEYYSEDPYLAGRMGAALVRGIQKNHVGASVKHFACNNKETNRKHSDSRVSERALREIYLKVFEIIVKEEEPYTIMSAYNVINGERASESKDLLTGILRDEWGYTGMVTSDWWNRAEQYKEILAGNDLKMATGFPERVKKAMEAGELSRNDLIICAKRILNTILKFD